jgi:hypothetical protein
VSRTPRVAGRRPADRRAAGPPDRDADGDIGRLLRLAGSVVAPTTLLTGLLVYFGQMYVAGYCRYFGVNFTALGLGVQEYLTRSVDGVFVPLALAAVTTLAAAAAHRLLRRLLDTAAPRTARAWRLAIAAGGGAALAVAGLALAGEDHTLVPAVPELGGLCLAGGVLLLAYVSRRPAAGEPPAGWAVARWGAMFLLVSIGLFWAVGSYANGVGTARARELAAGLAAWPDTVLYSTASLSLRGPGVRQTACADRRAAYRYRYDGLKLVLQSGDRYFFLPAGWSRTDGAALIIPRTDAVRLEFRLAGAQTAPAC